MKYSFAIGLLLFSTNLLNQISLANSASTVDVTEIDEQRTKCCICCKLLILLTVVIICIELIVCYFCVNYKKQKENVTPAKPKLTNVKIEFALTEKDKQRLGELAERNKAVPIETPKLKDTAKCLIIE